MNADLDFIETSSFRHLQSQVDELKERRPGCIVMAVLSDNHILDPELIDAKPYLANSGPHLAAALEEISQLAPDLVLFLGDFCNYGYQGKVPESEIDGFKALLQGHLDSKLETLGITGNHDNGEVNISKAYMERLKAGGIVRWPASESDDEYYYSVARFGWRIVAMDSGGEGVSISASQKAWLARSLQDSALPIMLLVHQPFVCVGTWMDEQRLVDEEVSALIRGSGNVRLILSGHTHKCASVSHNGALNLVFPSTSFGIEDEPGWGVVVLSEGELVALFRRGVSRDP